MGKVKSTRNKKRMIFNRKNRAYTEVILIVSILILFITVHNLQSNYGIIKNYWFGIEVSNLIIDFAFYFAIFLSFTLLIFIIHRNFTIRKKRKR